MEIFLDLFNIILADYITVSENKRIWEYISAVDSNQDKDLWFVSREWDNCRWETCYHVCRRHSVSLQRKSSRWILGFFWETRASFSLEKLKQAIIKSLCGRCSLLDNKLGNWNSVTWTRGVTFPFISLLLFNPYGKEYEDKKLDPDSCRHRRHNLSTLRVKNNKIWMWVWVLLQVMLWSSRVVLRESKGNLRWKEENGDWKMYIHISFTSCMSCSSLLLVVSSCPLFYTINNE